MKLWQKNTTIDKTIESFTIGNDRELDLQLAKYDIQGTLAHIQMLESIGLLEEEELSILQSELKKIYRQVENGIFKIEEGIEDVHSQVELMLTRVLGDVGKKVHSGRSRNDQVLVDLKLFFRTEIQTLTRDVGELFDVLLTLSREHQYVLMPGYTHMQVGMVSSFGLWFGAYAETLIDDLYQLRSTYHIVNQNLLGSAAGYGSSFPLNRKMTTDLLGFGDLNYNVVHAQMGRGKSELFLSFSIAAIAQTLSKLAMDICLFINQNFAFISFPEELTTGSSIMPHKKNPDVFELIRARCNQLIALPQQVSLISGNLMHGYHRDFQQLKELLFPAIQSIKDLLKMTSFTLPHIQVRDEILNEEKYQYLFSVEVVNQKVLEGIPFREAYQMVGKQITDGTFGFSGDIQHSHEGSIGNLCLEEISSKKERVVTGFSFEASDKAIKELIK